MRESIRIFAAGAFLAATFPAAADPLSFVDPKCFSEAIRKCMVPPPPPSPSFDAFLHPTQPAEPPPPRPSAMGCYFETYADLPRLGCIKTVDVPTTAEVTDAIAKANDQVLNAKLTAMGQANAQPAPAPKGQ